MRVVVTGATGNVGTSVLPALASDDRIDSIVGLARRVPSASFPKTQWVSADVSTSALEPIFEGADAVVHLAWLIQPSRDEDTLYATNVTGTRRVLEAVARAGVRAAVYASSIGAYSPGPKDRAVDETHPVDGISSSFYSRHKAETESILDRFQSEQPDIRCVRLRPALIFKREAAAEVRRFFFGPLLPGALVRARTVPVFPVVHGLRFQTVHSSDVGEAYRLAVVEDVRGAFNIAADPVLSLERVAELFGARPVPIPGGMLRWGAAVTWAAHLQPTPAGWVDMALNAPIMATDRARTELGWKATKTSIEALQDLVDGLRSESGFDTPPLSPSTGGRFRIREFLTGVGRR